MQPATHSLEITQLDADEAREVQPTLVAILREAVESNASVGFLPPLSDDEAQTFWEEVSAEVESGDRILLVARIAGHMAGTVQLSLARKPNARHRAEVQKLLVAQAYRRQGIGAALMARIAEEARRHNRTLLVLDTLLGCDAERLYRRIGYHEVGPIPAYARLPDGSLEATVIFYRNLDDTSPS